MKIAKMLLRPRDPSRGVPGSTDPPQCGPQSRIDEEASRPAQRPIRMEMKLLQGRILNGTRFGSLSHRTIQLSVARSMFRRRWHWGTQGSCSRSSSGASLGYASCPRIGDGSGGRHNPTTAPACWIIRKSGMLCLFQRAHKV